MMSAACWPHKLLSGRDYRIQADHSGSVCLRGSSDSVEQLLHVVDLRGQPMLDSSASSFIMSYTIALDHTDCSFTNMS